MRPSTLLREFQRLERPAPAGDGDQGKVFSVAEAYQQGVWLAKDREGRPGFLIRVSRADRRLVVPVDLPNLRVQHGREVTLYQEGVASRSEVLSIIECRAMDPEVHSAFVLAVGNALPGQLDAESVEALLDHLLELFRALEAAPLGTVLGLWGELFVISSAQNHSDWVHAWHSDPSGRFDFCSPEEQVEVKTTLHTRRVHVVGLDQLVGRTERRSYLLSIQTEETASGPSISELRTRVLRCTQESDSRAKVDRVVMRTLGRDWKSALQRSFDDQLAEKTVRAFACDCVPRVTGVPPEVCRVRFQVDLTDVEALFRSETHPASMLRGILR